MDIEVEMGLFSPAGIVKKCIYFNKLQQKEKQNMDLI